MNTISRERIQVGPSNQTEDHRSIAEKEGEALFVSPRTCSSSLRTGGGELSSASEEVKVTYDDLFNPPALDKGKAESRAEKESRHSTGDDRSGTPSKTGLDTKEDRYRGKHPFDYPIGDEEVDHSAGGDRQ